MHRKTGWHRLPQLVCGMFSLRGRTTVNCSLQTSMPWLTPQQQKKKDNNSTAEPYMAQSIMLKAEVRLDLDDCLETTAPRR
ncbi:hypothetical protein ANANG_G00143590 [Anguilla anguilla]|uniref:Uncharacterized protein n=1 Tax=Anguilla anguilla TaxID=7936 RepID=A0A9D3ME57_ANGAN|nr:hypothetical protein ANANG_G00143590 [Anguilla anguilla]